MNIRVDLNTNIADGSEVVFRSPADCSQVTGLVIYHNGGKTEFAFADAHGNNVGDIDHLFAENALVKVILDVTARMAFVQNADTNTYIERTFVKTVNGKAPDDKGNVEVKTPEGSGGTGLTNAEKSLILTLFRNATYTSADMGATLSQLETLWNGDGSGGGEGSEPDTPDVPDIPVVDGNDTTVQLEEYDKACSTNGNIIASSGLGVSKLYPLNSTKENGYDYLYGILPYADENVGSSTGRLHVYVDGVYTSVYSAYGSGKILVHSEGAVEGRVGINIAETCYDGFRVTIPYNHVDDCYLYLQSTGQVIFAGRNTPYYGMANIDGTPVVSQ